MLLLLRGKAYILVSVLRVQATCAKYSKPESAASREILARHDGIRDLTLPKIWRRYAFKFRPHSPLTYSS